MFAPSNRGKLIEKTDEGIPVSMNLLTKGFVSDDEIERYPGVTHQKGIHPVIECTQNIPCNPCQDACKKNCIKIGACITSLPVVASENCGCSLHEDFEPGFTSITIPYEFLPLPETGTVGKALSRSGEVLCDAEIVSVKSAGVFDHTHLLTMKVPNEFGYRARFWKLVKE